MSDIARSATPVQRLACEWPEGCAHVVEYTGTGRPARYCGQQVDGVVHNRLNAAKAREGKLRRRHHDPDEHTAGERPVSLARAGLEGAREELRELIDRHERAMHDVTARVAALLGEATDPEATAAEIAAVQRDARAQVDAAEQQAAADQAARRQAETAERDARADLAEAERIAEVALAERDEATARADETTEALAARDERLTVLDQQLAETTRDRDQLQRRTDRLDAQLVEAVIERDQARLERDHAQTAAAQQQERAETEAGAAAAARTENEQLTRRAETAEAARTRTEEQVDALRAELADERATIERLAGEVADSRTARAVAEAEIAALQRQLESALQAERDHAEQRLADERRQHTDYLHELQQRYEGRLAAAQADEPAAEDEARTASTRVSEARRRRGRPASRRRTRT